MHYIDYKMTSELKVIVKYIYIQWVILGYTSSLLKLIVLKNNRHGSNFKVTVYLVYPLSSEFNVLTDTTKFIITVIITSSPLIEI